jgi:uncharacterized BrkB/YihY/UPF0761 family membrane protein
VPAPSAIGPAYRRQLLRAQAGLQRVPGSGHALTMLKRDRRSGGALLAGALAFRLFAVMLPAALLLTVVLGYASTLDSTTPKKTGDAVGIAGTTMESIAQASRLSATSRWLLVVFAVGSLLFAAFGAAKAIHAAHSLAWTGQVERLPKPLPSALLLIVAVAVTGIVWAVVSKLRSESRLIGLAAAIAAVVPFTLVWLAVSTRLPHDSAPWRALLPGALLVGVGLEVIEIVTLLFLSDKLQSASATYGPLGAAFSILGWLFLVSRVIVASAMLNAVLWARREALSSPSPT